MKNESEEGLAELCPDDRKSAFPANAARLVEVIDQACPGILEDPQREVLRASITLSLETACVADSIIQRRAGRLSTWQAELLLQSLLLIVGVSTTTSVWNLLTLQVSDILGQSSAWQPRRYVETSHPITDFVASANALALAQSAEDVCARVVEVWRDACRCAAQVTHLLLMSYGSATTELRFLDPR